MAARSEAWVCGRSRRGIAGSSPDMGVDVPGECWVLSGIGLSDGPIPLPEESCRVWCVVYDIRISTLRRPRPQEKKIIVVLNYVVLFKVLVRLGLVSCLWY